MKLLRGTWGSLYFPPREAWGDPWSLNTLGNPILREALGHLRCAAWTGEWKEQQNENMLDLRRRDGSWKRKRNKELIMESPWPLVKRPEGEWRCGQRPHD